MKATRANLLGEFIGRMDGLIYYRRRPGGSIYVRREFKFKDHPGQPSFSSAQRAIYALKPSEGYKQNLKDYLIQFNELPTNREKPAQYWGNLYNKLMFAMQAKFPETVTLQDITREQIDTQSLPCRTVKDAVDAGLLPAVRDYQRFDRLI